MDQILKLNKIKKRRVIPLLTHCQLFQEAETLKLNEAKEQFQKQIQDAERKYNEKLSWTEEQLV